MTPSIDLPERIFKRLQALAEPFVDTPATVIERAIDALEGKSTTQPIRDTNLDERFKTANPAAVRVVSPGDAPNLTDTRIFAAFFAGTEVHTPYWNDLVRSAHDIALRRLGSISNVQRVTTANLVEGIKTDKGYKSVEGSGFSIQGVDANEAWRITYNLARKLNVAVDVGVEWRLTEKAEYPGEVVRLVWKP
jgi:predicted transcriptional regulator